MSNKDMVKKMERDGAKRTGATLLFSLASVYVSYIAVIIIPLYDDFQTHDGFGPNGIRWLIWAFWIIPSIITLIVLFRPKYPKGLRWLVEAGILLLLWTIGLAVGLRGTEVALLLLVFVGLYLYKKEVYS